MIKRELPSLLARMVHSDGDISRSCSSARRTVSGVYFPKPNGHGHKDGYQLSWLGEIGQARMTVPLAK